MDVRYVGHLATLYQLYENIESRIECVGDDFVKADMTNSKKVPWHYTRTEETNHS